MPGGRTAKIVASLAVVIVTLSMVTVATLAVFTDSTSVSGNTFTAGTVDITTAPTTAVVTATDLAPGDEVTAPLTVTNSGTLDLRYAVTSTTTEDVLAAELVLTIKVGVTTCDDANWAADGTTLYSGALGSTGTTAVLGSATQGADAGDRTLLSSTGEILCLNVTLPLAASSATEGVTTTATLTFQAEQTVNNP